METNKVAMPTLEELAAAPAALKTMQSPYNYSAYWWYLGQVGKEHFGPHFSLCEEDLETLLRLLSWFLKDRSLMEKFNLESTKGILLAGPVGSGKTALMHLLRWVLPARQRPLIKSCRDIAFEFSTTGYEVIQRYSKNAFSPYTATYLTLCFDDLGLEPIVQYYGNPCNTVAEILLSRYDLYVAHGSLTHATTSLSASEIEKSYGTRVRSRLRSMMNLISFPAHTPDKRI